MELGRVLTVAVATLPLGAAGRLAAQAPAAVRPEAPAYSSFSIGYSLSSNERRGASLAVGLRRGLVGGLAAGVAVQFHSMNTPFVVADYTTASPCPPGVTCGGAKNRGSALVIAAAGFEAFEHRRHTGWFLGAEVGPGVLLREFPTPGRYLVVAAAGLGLAFPMGTTRLRVETRYLHGMRGGFEPLRLMSLGIGIQTEADGTGPTIP